MKKLIFVAFASIFMMACNDTSEHNSLSSDSLGYDNHDQKDVNNRNVTVYDSVDTRKDTGSYERMTNKTGNNKPQ